jgi:N-acetyl sugar amidotransferase
MDTSDPDIVFDSDGVCNHCIEFDRTTRQYWHPGPEGHAMLEERLEGIRLAGRGKEYDCILGLSGGVDSSYLALKAKEWNLRPLVVHVDAGWNSELAVANIESLVKHCGFDLHTDVIDWEDMRELQLAYLRAGIANQDVPQDHVFFSSLYHFAISNGIRHILSGGNIATEGIWPRAWHGPAMDAINLRDVHRRFGSRPLRTYSTISFSQYYLWFPLVRRMRTLRPLNFLPYRKEEALAELVRVVGYKPYPRKHGESVFTKWFQNHYLPFKHGYDKRLPHLSSLVVSGQMTRDEALRKLDEPLYAPDELEQDIAYLCKKLRLTRAQYDELMMARVHHFREFATWDSRQQLLKRAQSIIARITGRRLKVYS